jgi:hypothetical protein
MRIHAELLVLGGRIKTDADCPTRSRSTACDAELLVLGGRIKTDADGPSWL